MPALRLSPSLQHRKPGKSAASPLATSLLFSARLLIPVKPLFERWVKTASGWARRRVPRRHHHPQRLRACKPGVYAAAGSVGPRFWNKMIGAARAPAGMPRTMAGMPRTTVSRQLGVYAPYPSRGILKYCDLASDYVMPSCLERRAAGIVCAALVLMVGSWVLGWCCMGAGCSARIVRWRELLMHELPERTF